MTTEPTPNQSSLWHLLGPVVGIGHLSLGFVVTAVVHRSFGFERLSGPFRAKEYFGICAKLALVRSLLSFYWVLYWLGFGLDPHRISSFRCRVFGGSGNHACLL